MPIGDIVRYSITSSARAMKSPRRRRAWCTASESAATASTIHSEYLRNRHLDAERSIRLADHPVRGVGVGMPRLHLLSRIVAALDRNRSLFEGLRACEERAGRAARGSHFSAALS